MRVDDARHNRLARHIDQLGAVGYGGAGEGSGVSNAAAFNDQRRVLNRGAAVAVNQPSMLDDVGLRRGIRGDEESCKKETQHEPLQTPGF